MKLTKLITIIILLTVLFMFINSCATTAKYEALLDQVVGNNINKVVSVWGPPSDTYKMPNGNMMYIYMQKDGTFVNQSYNQYSKQTTTIAVTMWCETTFIVDGDGIIIGYRYRGNNCKSTYDG